MAEEKINIKVKTSDPQTDVKVTGGKKGPKDISKMNLSELKELHEKKTAIYWKVRNELNEISKLIQNKGGY